MSTPTLSTSLRTNIAGVAIHDLAREFGTPTFVYDAAQIAKRISDLRAFDHIRYAQKACSNLAILDFMRRQDVLVDAVSAGEVRRAIAAGYQVEGDPPPVVYTADIFDREALDLVVESNIHVNCGSPDMIDQLGERAPGRAITLRINPGFGHGHSQKTNTGGEQSKHGIWHEQIAECLRRADHHGLEVRGVHVHIGSGADLEHLSRVAGAVESFAKEVGRTITSISAGGGLPIRYQPDDESVDVDAYFARWDETRRRLETEFGHPVQLEIEPGRFLVAESGYLIAEIRAIKQMGSNLFYVVDAGFNNLARPILYGAYHPMSIAPREHPNVERELHDVVVGGPLCESGDIFTQTEGGFVRKQKLPRAQVGDLLVIECAGAYGVVMGSNYNSRPMAAEVLVDSGETHLIRRRQSFAEMTACEMIPRPK